VARAMANGRGEAVGAPLAPRVGTEGRGGPSVEPCRGWGADSAGLLVARVAAR
jgi:hypothetical protein